MPRLSCRTAARCYYTSNSTRVCVCASDLTSLSVLVCVWVMMLVCLPVLFAEGRVTQSELGSSSITFAWNILWRICKIWTLQTIPSRRRVSQTENIKYSCVVRRLSLALMVREPVLMIRELIKLCWCDWGWLLETRGTGASPSLALMKPAAGHCL